MEHKLKGKWDTKRVWLDGVELTPQKSQQVFNHSPDGFNWGYGGSGPAQLALAICLELTQAYHALRIHQDFKWAHIAKLPQSDFEIIFNVNREV